MRRPVTTEPEIRMPTEEQRRVAFGFGRRLADPEFRDYLTEAGHRGGETSVLTFVGDETVRDVLGRLRDRDPGERAPVMLACPDPDAPHGWALALAGGHQEGR